MPIVLIPATWWDLFWLIYRTTMQVIFVGGFLVGVWIVARHTRIVKKMLVQIQDDRLERDQNLADVKRLAEELAQRTSDINTRVEERDAGLKEQISENTELTRAAAMAAKDAYHEANSVNVKIAQTNEHLERAIQKTEGLPPVSTDDVVRQSLEQIDKNTAQIAENTKKPRL
jgi:uncharacterized phage infection (PIP) family protein YhgE